MYDYLIVGAGVFGSVFTYEASKCGKRCFVIDQLMKMFQQAKQ